jgi:hypothetical protein
MYAVDVDPRRQAWLPRWVQGLLPKLKIEKSESLQNTPRPRGAHPVRCTPKRCTPMRCTPMRCTPMRCTPSEVYAHGCGYTSHPLLLIVAPALPLLVIAPPTLLIVAPPATISLQLIRQHQIGPDHWSPFLGYEGQPGKVYQVKGDAIAMRHQHSASLNLLVSGSFKDAHVIANPSSQQSTRIDHWAVNEPPPSALNQGAVQENCQGWTIRVLRHLVEEGIMQQDRLTYIESFKESLR